MSAGHTPVKYQTVSELMVEREKLKALNADLLAALQDVLRTRSQEAKLAAAYTVASENFSGPTNRESNAHARAMQAASKAEENARKLIAKATGK